MAVVSQSWESLRLWWQTATPATRAAATGMVLLLVIGLAVALSMAASPDYQPIYHGVSGKDASAIETVLREHSIPMKFSDRDGTVSVPSKDESNATMYVEAAGILGKDTDIVGIESLDKIGMGTSSDVERQRILAANEGELSRKLMRLDPVQTAAVTISPASNSSLFGSDTAPSASVILSLKQGETLDSNQVKGIVYLIAHAVQGLSPQNVTLTDQSGAPLWKDNGAGGNALGDGQPIDEDAKYAENERKKLQGLMDNTVGPHKVLVTVNAELNFDQTQEDSVKHTPSAGSRTGLPVSVREKEENYTGGGMPGAGGIAGAASNLSAPSYAGGGNNAGGAYKSGDTLTNYENDVTHTVVQKAPGAVQKMSVAAIVDSAVPPENLPRIKDILGTAIGAMPGDATRLVSVQQMAFDTSALKAQSAAMQSAASQQLWITIARSLAVAVVAIVLLFLMTRAGGRRREPQLALAGGGANVGLLEDASDDELSSILEERPLRVEDVLAEMPEPEIRRSSRRRAHAPAIEEQQDVKLESIQDMVATTPEAVALLLKGWMADEARLPL